MAKFGFTTQLQTIDFDLKSYQNVLDQRMQELTKEAGRSWLNTVLSIVPTWSRASRATFEKLAKEVGEQVTFGPLAAKKDRTNLGQSNSDGGVEFKGNEYHFFYETTLRYLEYNEFNAASPGAPPKPYGQLINPTPYNFLEAGANNFRSFAANIKLPDVSLFISGKPI